MFTNNKRYFVGYTLLLLVLLLAGCGTSTESEQPQGNLREAPEERTDYPAEVEENPIVTITMEDDAVIVIELDPHIAPNTVANFVSLAEEGFYDGLTFHRVIPGFMIQGGDPEGNGRGGPGYSIAGEFALNGFDNNLKHERGVISMARGGGDPNSAGSQFFIVVEESPHLDGQYAAFGRVIEGMEAVDAIVAAPRDSSDKPLEDQRMKKVEVDTKGFPYPDPIVQR